MSEEKQRPPWEGYKYEGSVEELLHAILRVHQLRTGEGLFLGDLLLRANRILGDEDPAGTTLNDLQRCIRVGIPINRQYTAVSLEPHLPGMRSAE